MNSKELITIQELASLWCCPLDKILDLILNESLCVFGLVEAQDGSLVYGKKLFYGPIPSKKIVDAIDLMRPNYPLEKLNIGFFPIHRFHVSEFPVFFPFIKYLGSDEMSFHIRETRFSLLKVRVEDVRQLESEEDDEIVFNVADSSIKFRGEEIKVTTEQFCLLHVFAKSKEDYLNGKLQSPWLKGNEALDKAGLSSQKVSQTIRSNKKDIHKILEHHSKDGSYQIRGSKITFR